jgi:hypothetical protein
MFHSPIPAGPRNGAEQNVYALLGDRARHRSLEHLATEAAIGVIGALGLAIAHPTWWALYLPLGVLASYGLWGVLDRAAHGIASAHRVIRGALIGADWLLAITGTACVVAFFLALTRVAFQGWIH